MNFLDSKVVPLTMEEMRSKVPAAFTDSPAPEVSKYYTFVPTFEIIENFEREGWVPVKAKQIKTKDIDNIAYQEHSIRFRNENFQLPAKVGDIIPEIYIRNSHNRVCQFTGALAMERLRCTNGLIASEEFSRFAIVHADITFETIKKWLNESLNQFTELAHKIELFSNQILSPVEKFDFARKVRNLNWGEQSTVDPEDLLQIRRIGDESSDLFTVFNVIQENIIKGGVGYKSGNPEIPVRHTKAITAIGRDFKLNTEMWNMMVTISNSKIKNH